ncbi:hypothetical protein [Polaromonas glacialis]|uniref:hypothetical protein n=1 Tax=Polaromonas glacialis TaxID=866564 RepID=UPI000A07AB8C|nr:hypothetical protein [Polaromonas glacialis]
MKQLLNLCFLVASLTLGQAALAQSPAVTSTLTAQRVDMVNGKAVLKPAAQSKPGEVIEYSGIYRNAGTTAVDKLQAIVPVPAGTTFVPGSALPAAALASIDGTRFAPLPLTRMVRQADGSERKETVPLAEYRALRWDVGSLGAGTSAVVSLRVRIDAPVAASGAKP